MAHVTATQIGRSEQLRRNACNRAIEAGHPGRWCSSHRQHTVPGPHTSEKGIPHTCWTQRRELFGSKYRWAGVCFGKTLGSRGNHDTAGTGGRQRSHFLQGVFCQPITAPRGTSQGMAETSIPQEWSSSREPAASHFHRGRESQLSRRLAVRPQYRERKEAPTINRNDPAANHVTQDALLRDIVSQNQRLSTSQTATPELTPSTPWRNTTLHRRQPLQGSTITIQHGRQIFEQKFVINRRSGHAWSREGIFQYDFG